MIVHVKPASDAWRQGFPEAPIGSAQIASAWIASAWIALECGQDAHIPFDPCENSIPEWLVRSNEQCRVK